MSYSMKIFFSYALDHSFSSSNCPFPIVPAHSDYRLPYSLPKSPPSLEPRSLVEVVEHPEWREAMQVEILALEKINTWTLTALPAGKKAIGCKWVLKTKLSADGSVERYEMRLVAKGYNQIEGVDYTDSFSLMAKAVIIFICYLSRATKLVCKLEWSLYDLKQASRQWNVEDIGYARYFLGLKIARNSGGIYLAQTKYTLDIIKDTRLQHAKRVPTTFPHGLNLSTDSGALLKYPNFTEGWDALISWKTKKQLTVSAKYRSLAATVCELWWISFLLIDHGIPLHLSIDLLCDNKDSLHILANLVFHERKKHIELDYQLVCDAYKDGFVSPGHVCSSAQLVDMFTKVLPLKTFSFLLSKLGLVSLAPSPTCRGLLDYLVLLLFLMMMLAQG
ncbi:UNVERIFIED_CONTAM: putative mitochondrial protein [Sesamum latifolium]|uniref:Mitochondrial protein n=1 Tax=Sesamum latifolium TaxID=2727402 RepID=A0AAW2W2A5_9LAMI